MSDLRIPKNSFSHIGICVSDVDKSMRFYSQALGFKVAESYDCGADSDGPMEISGVNCRAQYLRRDDGFSIELLHFQSPEGFGPRVRRPMNQYGVTHVAFFVEDLDAAMARVRQFGGAVRDSTFKDLVGIKLVACTDPDGVCIELMQLRNQ
jgi:predicted enzyme related to lactoylglutathione lyase